MIRFGTGGWRAVIGEEFTKENVYKVANGILGLILEENKGETPVIIGYDRRFLSEAAAKWVAEVLASGGIQVMFLHRSAPTPLVMHTVLKQNLHFGIEITASHNPPQYNGIKLIIDEGRDASVEVTTRVEQLIVERGTPEPVSFEELVLEGKITYPRNLFNGYIDDILAAIDTKAIRERGLRILFDSMHGSSTYPLMTVFYTARCTVDAMNINKDAWFGGQMPAPDKKLLQSLEQAVVKEHYDYGIALDGDGDRLGVIDGSGRYISANEILCMLYYYLVQYKGWKGPVVRNLSTTHMLDRIAESFGEKCYEVPVGFKWISSGIDQHDAVLGGESSGGLTVRGHIHGKDSIYAASLFAEMVSVTGMSPVQFIEELEKKFGHFETAEYNLTFTPEQKAAVQKKLLEEKVVPAFNEPVSRISYMDGCKVYFENGDYVLCRFSGTEPLLRISSESSTSEKASGYINAFRKLLLD